MSVPCAHSPGFRNPPPALAPFHPRLHVASARSRMTCRTKEDAMLYIAQIDQEGKGVPKDLEQAVAYRKVAAAPDAGLRPSSAPWGANSAVAGRGTCLSPRRRQADTACTTWRGTRGSGSQTSLQRIRMPVDVPGDPQVRRVHMRSRSARFVALLAWAALLLPSAAAAQEPPAQTKPAAGTVVTKGVELYSKGKAADDNGAYADAMGWYRQAAEAGNTDAMNRLGVMYDNGQGAAEDPVQAVAWFRKAAEAGDPAGMNNLASMYGHGRGVPQDEGQSVRWYRKAADAGDEWGTISLGMMYENGRGVPKDVEQAVEWYRKAAAAGSKTARAILERLGRK